MSNILCNKNEVAKSGTHEFKKMKNEGALTQIHFTSLLRPMPPLNTMNRQL